MAAKTNNALIKPHTTTSNHPHHQWPAHKAAQAHTHPRLCLEVAADSTTPLATNTTTTTTTHIPTNHNHNNNYSYSRPLATATKKSTCRSVRRADRYPQRRARATPCPAQRTGRRTTTRPIQSPRSTRATRTTPSYAPHASGDSPRSQRRRRRLWSTARAR